MFEFFKKELAFSTTVRNCKFLKKFISVAVIFYSDICTRLQNGYFGVRAVCGHMKVTNSPLPILKVCFTSHHTGSIMFVYYKIKLSDSD